MKKVEEGLKVRGLELTRCIGYSFEFWRMAVESQSAWLMGLGQRSARIRGQVRYHFLYIIHSFNFHVQNSTSTPSARLGHK